MTTVVPGPRGAFAAEVRRAEPELNLARAALLLAKEEYPQLPVDAYLGRLDELAEMVRDRLAEETAPPVVLAELIRTLYEREHFRGNSEAYYDPRNSFLNDVLDRGLGIPLTLGILLLEVGWRLDLPLEGVRFPRHFLVRFRGQDIRLLIDPFDGGTVRFEDQAQEVLDRVYGGSIAMQAGFLRTATKREMLARMLTNLKGIYLHTQDDVRGLAAVERILLITPTESNELRDRGILLARTGRREEAVEQLEEYLDHAPAAPDAGHIRSVVDQLRGDGGGGAGSETPVG
jgi:regulator of sirC expression with transglutaminase-like and TPR domain